MSLISPFNDNSASVVITMINITVVIYINMVIVNQYTYLWNLRMH